MFRRRTAIKAAAVTVIASATLGMAGCSSGDESTEASSGELTKVTLQLQWVTQAQFGGYYAALDQGYYEDAGLDVDIVPAGTDTVPQDALTSGAADYAVAWVPKVLGSIEQGAEITNVAQIFERSGTLQISFKDQNITSVSDLAGKKVGSWGYGNQWELFAGMQKAGGDTENGIDLVSQAFDMNGFLNGDIDAAQAMTYNEYAQVLETTNPATGELYTADDLNVIDWNDEGSAMLQDAIWADSERLANDEAYQETTEKFIKATLKGWIYQRDHVQETADIVTEAGSTLGASHQLWMANEINKLIWPSTEGIGHIREELWQQTIDIAKTTKDDTGSTIISADPPETAYTNEYVDKALEELKAEGVDVDGSDYEPIEVTLNEGGN